MLQSISILDYLNAIYRYRLVSVCTIVVGVVLTGWTVHSLPNVYQSTTLIMVEPQDVPESYVRATVTTQLDKRLQAMNQEVLSRTRLETIINDLKLYPQLRENGTAMERIVDEMRRNVLVQVFPQNNAFRISFEGREPSTVQQVTARLAGLYIDENLRIREEQVSGTTDFMESELEKARQQLEDQESQIQTFKQQHMGELPEQRESNMRALEGLRMQMQTVSTALSAALERKVLLDKQVSEAKSLSSRPGADGRQTADSPLMRLRQLQAQLVDLKARYTSEHPDVIQTQNQIARIKEDLKGQAADEVDDAEHVDTAPVDPFVPPDLTRNLAQTQLEINRLKQDEERIKQAIPTYQDRVEKAFVREQELQNLTRDYDVTKRKYQTLLDKKLEAQLSQSLERRQKAERFRILDPASRPQTPTRPNRQMLAGGGLVLSLGLAIFLPFLLWQLDTSFHMAEDIAAAALPVLAVIPQLQTADIRRRQIRYRVQVLGVSAVALVVGLSTASIYARYF